MRRLRRGVDAGSERRRHRTQQVWLIAHLGARPVEPACLRTWLPPLPPARCKWRCQLDQRWTALLREARRAPPAALIVTLAACLPQAAPRHVTCKSYQRSPTCYDIHMRIRCADKGGPRPPPAALSRGCSSPDSSAPTPTPTSPTAPRSLALAVKLLRLALALPARARWRAPRVLATPWVPRAARYSQVGLANIRPTRIGPGACFAMPLLALALELMFGNTN